MIIPLSYFGSLVLYVSVFWFSAFISGQKMKSRMLQIAIMSFLPFLIAGFRYNVGWDYNSYSWGFDLFDANTSFWTIFKAYQFGDSLGLNIVLKITKMLDSKFLYFAVTSALCFVPAFSYLLREWNDEKHIVPLAVFFTGFTLFFTGLSAIKQGIAISFCLCALTYVFTRKPLKFLLFIVVAFLFHSSALIFLPVYFIGEQGGRIRGLKKFCVIAAAFLFVVFLSELLAIFGGERFQEYGTAIVQTNNYLFFLMLFWLIVFLLYRKKLVLLDTRNELLIMLYAIAVVFMLLGFRSAFTKRIAYYFDVVQIVLFPQLTLLFSRRSRKLVIVFIGMYIVLVFMMLNSGTAENMAPIPYSFLFGE